MLDMDTILEITVSINRKNLLVRRFDGPAENEIWTGDRAALIDLAQSDAFVLMNATQYVRKTAIKSYGSPERGRVRVFLFHEPVAYWLWPMTEEQTVEARLSEFKAQVAA